MTSNPSGLLVIVSVASTFLAVNATIESWASRMEVYDDGTGLEFESKDPVVLDVLTGATVHDLPNAHRMAMRILNRRRGYDYEIADLFIADLDSVG
ncbi:hypothetical protein [Arthrobacter cryoconiti]|uniref:Uncharacterized protein n=1 Tax=Arthrobacter cryoconiti TaxID=748907 RepID=A0ABV8R5X9_9MICC|nr:hypothetical protein [Arthrobacter cryoconiti]MCC9069315.1 hypothetical protein [Arthrobacter cryoconiti]